MSKEIKAWEEVSREEAFSKYGKKIEKVDFKLPDGKVSDFYIKKEGPAVGILALTKDNEVILAKQFRPGPKEVLNELPGGYLDENETPEQAAERELLEETGYKGKAQFVTKAYDCAYSTMERSCVVVTGCGKVSDQNLDETEDIEINLMPLADFRELLRSGKNTDIEVAYLGLDHLGLL